MKPRKFIKRSPLRHKRKPNVTITKDGRTILRGAAMTAKRHEVYVRSGGLCEVKQENKSPRCKIYVTEETGHLMHIIPRRAGGGSRDDVATVTVEDDRNNLLFGCCECHRFEHNILTKEERLLRAIFGEKN